jgi:branched-chain amino acid transport system substrate-binding protein
MKIIFATSIVLAIGASQVDAKELNFGASLSMSGPAASLGVSMAKAVEVLPKSISSYSIVWTILDDGTDPTLARKNIEKLTIGGADLILGSSTTPTSLAMIEVAARSQTPMIASGPSPSIVAPMDAQKTWVFKVPLGEPELAARTLRHMTSGGIRRLAFIGFNDALGEGWYAELNRLAPSSGIQITATERYARNDSSVTGQILKIMATRPDAVFVGATGTPAVLPTAALIERGYRGKIYQTSGVINNDFLRVGGKSIEGVFLAGSPLVVADQLPDANVSKTPALAFKKVFESAYGNGSVTSFAGNIYDAWLILEAAVPVALKKAEPGTSGFRAALREAIEGVNNLPTISGVMTMSATNHGGYTPESPVMLTVKNGGWALAD